MRAAVRPTAPLIDPVTINAVLIAVRQAAHVVCDRTTLLVVLHAHAGACRYADFSERTQLASRLLSTRLEQLEANEILVRIPYSRRPLRHEYHLTHMGLALFDVLALAASWEQCWHGVQAAPVGIEHIDCGMVTAVEQRCAVCQLAVSPRDIELRVSQREIEKMPSKLTGTRRSTQGLQPSGAAAAVPLAHALEVLGDKWTIEIVVAAFFRVQQFGEFGLHLGIASNILADRLQRLVRVGVLARSTDTASYPKGAYMLTAKGRAFYPILTAIQHWADTWLDKRVRSPVKLRHSPCGQLLRPVLACSGCRQPVDRGNSRIVVPAPPALPGAG